MPPEGDPPEVKTFTQEQVNALLAETKRKVTEKFTDYPDLKSKAEQFDAIQEQNKTDLQKLTDRATAAEQRAQEAEQRALKADVAIAKGVPMNLLAGATKEELEQSADALLAFRGNTEPPPPATVKAVTPGGGAGKASSVAQVMADRAAAREAKK